MNNEGLEVVRVLFLNIEQGDRLKFDAKSNISDSGGGARDLRFRPETEFLPFFERMLPSRRNIKRSSKMGFKIIEILSGVVTWQEESGAEKSSTIEIWPSTDARPNECRLAKISRLGLSDLIQDDPNRGKSVFMMFQQRDGTIRLYFTTETSLKNDNWDKTIKDFTANWLRTRSKSAFLDLETKEHYPHD